MTTGHSWWHCHPVLQGHQGGLRQGGGGDGGGAWPERKAAPAPARAAGGEEPRLPPAQGPPRPSPSPSRSDKLPPAPARCRRPSFGLPRGVSEPRSAWARLGLGSGCAEEAFGLCAASSAPILGRGGAPVTTANPAGGFSSSTWGDGLQAPGRSCLARSPVRGVVSFATATSPGARGESWRVWEEVGPGPQPCQPEPWRPRWAGRA